MFSKFFAALSPAKKTAYLAVFIALSVVANSFSIDVTPTFKITCTYTVCFFAAFLLGAAPAFLVGFLGDTLGFLLMPQGSFWLFGVTLGLYGFFAGIILHYIPLQGKRGLLVKTLLAFAVCYLLVTVCLNTIVNYTYMIVFIWQGQATKTIWVFLAGRIGLQSAVYAINVGVSILLLPVASRLCHVKKMRASVNEG